MKRQNNWREHRKEQHRRKNIQNTWPMRKAVTTGIFNWEKRKPGRKHDNILCIKGCQEKKVLSCSFLPETGKKVLSLEVGAPTSQLQTQRSLDHTTLGSCGISIISRFKSSLQNSLLRMGQRQGWLISWVTSFTMCYEPLISSKGSCPPESAEVPSTINDCNRSVLYLVHLSTKLGTGQGNTWQFILMA